MITAYHYLFVDILNNIIISKFSLTSKAGGSGIVIVRYTKSSVNK